MWRQGLAGALSRGLRSRCRALRGPVERSEARHHPHPADETRNAYHRGGDEGRGEVTGFLDEQPRERGCDYAREGSAAILNSHPATRGRGPREDLRYGIDARRGGTGEYL